MKRELNIVVISDVHLGTYGCHAKELLNYLNSIRVDTLVLNGDFIDMSPSRKRYFPKEHIQVIQRILKMAAGGTKVYYITGNHDDILRKYTNFSSGNIHLRNKLILQLKNKTYWIFHGDVFDNFIKYSPFIARLGGKGYDFLIWVNRWVNKLGEILGRLRPYFVKNMKSSVKKAVKFINDFENIAIQLAIDQEYDYVICGHIHKAQIRTQRINEHEVTYLNSGDWVESLTALEYNCSNWSIYEYDEMDYTYVNLKLKVKELQGNDNQTIDIDLSTHAIFQEIMKEQSSRNYLG